MAAGIVEQATDEEPQDPESPQAQAGRLGGQKGGKARAGALTAQERSDIAKKAARARWG